MDNLLLGNNAQFFRFSYNDFVKALVADNISAVDLTLLSPHIYIDSFEILDPCHVIEMLHANGISVEATTPVPYRYSICAEAGTMQRERTLGYYRQCIIFTKKAGAKFLLLTASGANFDTASEILLENAAEVLSILASFAEECGVTLLLGTVFGPESPLNASSPVLLTLPDVKNTLQRVNSPALKAYLDTAVISLVGETISQWFAQLGKEGVLALFAWAPFYVTNKLKTLCFPETIEKLNKA